MMRKRQYLAVLALLASALLGCSEGASSDPMGLTPGGQNPTNPTMGAGGTMGGAMAGAMGSAAGTGGVMTTGGTTGTGGVGAAGMAPSTAGAMATAGAMSTAGTEAGTSAAGGAMANAGDGGGNAGEGGTMANAGTGSTGSTAGTVTVEFTTVTYGGEYAPLNYGAVWFETADGQFIRTAKRWAGEIHAGDLVAWSAASGGWGFFGGNTEDMADAISRATIREHEMHSIEWDLMDNSGSLLPDGEYVAVLEMSEDRALRRAGPVIRIPFSKGPDAQTADVPDQEGFSGVTLTYTP